jgi:hypothetical protein
MTARRRDAAKVGTLARRVVARKRGPSGDAPRTRSLEEWCGQGRTRPHSVTFARVATRPLRPKLAPAGSGRTAETRMRPVATRLGPVPRSHPRKRARRRAEQGSLWDVTPQTREGRRATRLGRLHCRIPTSGAPAPSCAGPCSLAHARTSIPRAAMCSLAWRTVYSP